MYLIFLIILFSNSYSLIIETSLGKIEGQTEQTSLNNTFYSFRGIPFARPPVGDLRFKAPEPPEKWPGLLTALKDASKCTQFLNDGSEDCLYLNIYSSDLTPKNLLPVMVFIHGGYFLAGDNSKENYGPDYFIDEAAVVLVTLNYRLGVFGFLSTEDEASPGNYGLKDQLLALEFVQENVKFFGGNPKNVLLFGQSAGSVSVSYLLQNNYLNKTLFNKVILQSGNTLMAWSKAQTPKETAFTLGRNLGIKTRSSSELVKYLRKKTSKEILHASTFKLVGQTFSTNILNGFVFGPSPEPFFISNYSHVELQKGRFNQVPILMGLNSNEASYFANIIKFLRIYLFSYDLIASRLVPEDMNAKDELKKTLGSIIKEYYFGKSIIAFSDHKIFNFTNDDLFNRPSVEYARLTTQFVPVYFYLFAFESELGQRNRKYQGVGHSEENNYLFKTKLDLKNPTKQEVLTRQRLVKLWTNFAYFSNPTPKPEELLQNLLWPKTSPHSMSYLNIGRDLELKQDFANESIAFWKNLYNSYGNPPFNTY